jgi:hypothetical protein
MSMSILDAGHQRDDPSLVLDAAPEHQQPGELTRVERIRCASSGAKAEPVGLIMVSRTLPI